LAAELGPRRAGAIRHAILGQDIGMDDRQARGRIVTVFRSRLRPDAEANGYGELAARMEARARAMAGFVDFKTFRSEDGERVSIICFDTIEHHTAWREDPEHRAAQAKGREAFYSEYFISVCEELRHRRFALAVPTEMP
jgi:heme-degrading monooxygenase HmoA